jgi:hypothetical protein
MPGALTDVTAFYPPDQVEVLDASTGQWVAVTDPTQYYNLFTGEWGAPSWISISNAYNGIRFTWTSFPYRWIKAIWMYIMPKDNTFNIKLEVSSDGVTWTEVFYDTNMRGWPSHYLHVFDSYVSTNGKPYLRLTIEFNWTGTQTTVAIGGIRVFASYDWITRANYLPFTADYSRNITFYGNVSPNSDNTQDLGSTTLRWSNIHSWNAHFNVLTIRDSSWTTRFQLDLDTTNSRIVFRSPYSYQFQFAEDIVPGNDNAFDLGSSTYRWRNLYLAGNASTDKNKYFRVGLTMLHQQSADEGGIYFNVYNDGTGWKVLDTTKRGYLVQLGLDSIDFWFTQTVGGTDWALKFRVMYNGTWYTYGTGYVQTMLPKLDATYDLGSSTYRWRNAYLSGSAVLGDGTLKLSQDTSNYNLRIDTAYGYVKIGAANTLWIHFLSDGKPFYFSTKVSINGNLYPYQDSAYDLGTPSNRWRDLYVARDAVIEKLWSVPEMILAEDDEGLTAFVSTSGGTSYVVAFFDNTVVYVNGKFQGVLNAGQRLQLTLNAGDVVTANKPIMLHSSSERHVPMTWKDTKFVIPFYRNDPQTIYIYAPDADAIVDIYVGTSTTPTTTVTVTKGTATKVQINVTPPNTVILESTAPILVAVSSNNETYDFRFVPPPATDLILIPSNIFYVSALEDNTTITWFQGNNSGTYTLNRGEIVSSTTLGITTGTQYNATPVRVIADKPIMIASFADGDGTDATNGLPVNKLGTLYVLPVAAQWLAIAVPFDNTRIKIYYQGQLKYETTVSNTYTYNTPALLYLTPSTIDSTWTSIPYGTMIESDKPIMVIFDCAEVWTDDETILLGINHRKWRIYYNEALTLTTDIVPPQDATYDLGSSSYYWRDLYLKGSIHNLNTMWMSATTGDKISLYDNRLGATNMYGFGVEASTLYYKSWAYHRWYINANADGGASAVMQLSSSDLKLRVPILPWSDNTYDLGSSTLRWRNFYAVNAYVTTLSVGDLLLTGHGARWRLVEREDGIYLLNEKTGKWYRVVLEEVGGVGA